MISKPSKLFFDGNFVPEMALPSLVSVILIRFRPFEKAQTCLRWQIFAQTFGIQVPLTLSFWERMSVNPKLGVMLFILNPISHPIDFDRGSRAVWPEKKSPNVYKSCPNDFTRKMIDFDTFTKIACGRFGKIICCQSLWKVAQSPINRLLCKRPFYR